MNKISGMKFNTIEEFHMKTVDDWYPCFPNDMVRIRYFINSIMMFKYISQYKKEESWIHTFHISVWGADDTGMDRTFEFKENAEIILDKLKKLPYISRKNLKKLGFKSV